MGRTKKVISAMMIVVMTFSVFAGIAASSAELVQAKTTKRTYLIKVNKKKNVVTVYKRMNTDGTFKYSPIRAIRVSCGRATTYSNTTPSGIFKVKRKHKWGALYGNVWGRYTIQFYRDYLFHTVPYKYRKKPSSEFVKEYKKLGKKASAGCVRMSFLDEKWLSKTCPKGTRVVVYKSSIPGPLGKPKAVAYNKKVNIKKKKLYYDPTDPVKGNKGYNLKAPVITIKAGNDVKQGETFDPKKGITAKDSRSFQDLTGYIKYNIFVKEQKKNEDGTYNVNWKKVGKVSTQKSGAEYRIDYRCYYKYCSKYTGKATRFIKIAQEDDQESGTDDGQENIDNK